MKQVLQKEQGTFGSTVIWSLFGCGCDQGDVQGKETNRREEVEEMLRCHYSMGVS